MSKTIDEFLIGTSPDDAADVLAEAVDELAEMVVEKEIRTVQKTDRGEREIVTYQQPEWSKVMEKAEAILRRSPKHLRAGLVYTLAALESDGFRGLGDGLHLLAGLMEKSWESLHPALEPDKPRPSSAHTATPALRQTNREPTITFRESEAARAAILEDLSTAGAEGEDAYRIVVRVQFTKLLESPGHDCLSFSEIEAARNPASFQLGAGRTPPKVEDVEAAWVAAGPGQLREILSQLNYATAGLERVLSVYSAKAGNKGTLNLKLLQDALRRISATVTKRSAGQPAGGAKGQSESDERGDAKPTSGAEANETLPGTVERRPDALRALEAARRYYARFEPTSPVLLLIGLAQEVSDKSFVELLERLPPASVEHLKTSFKSIVGASSASAPAGASNRGLGAEAKADGVIQADIQSRGEALRALGAAREYLVTAEPASPVPLLMALAQEVSGRNFDQLLERLPTGAVKELKAVFKKPEETQKPVEKK